MPGAAVPLASEPIMSPIAQNGIVPTSSATLMRDHLAGTKRRACRWRAP